MDVILMLRPRASRTSPVPLLIRAIRTSGPFDSSSRTKSFRLRSHISTRPLLSLVSSVINRDEQAREVTGYRCPKRDVRKIRLTVFGGYSTFQIETTQSVPAVMSVRLSANSAVDGGPI